MALDKATIRARVRAIIGNPSTDDISDDTINWFIDIATMEVGEKSQGDNAIVGELTTVADQQNYDPAEGAGEIIDVWWRGDATAATIHLDIAADANSYLIDYPGPIGDIGFDQRSLDLIHEMKVDRWYNISSRGHYWVFLSGQIWLDPPPVESGLTVYYLYSTAATLLSTISDEKERGIVWYACWQSLITVASARAGAGVVYRESLEGQKSVNELLENAIRYKAMWDDFVIDMTGGHF